MWLVCRFCSSGLRKMMGMTAHVPHKIQPSSKVSSCHLLWKALNLTEVSLGQWPCWIDFSTMDIVHCHVGDSFAICDAVTGKSPWITTCTFSALSLACPGNGNLDVQSAHWFAECQWCAQLHTDRHWQWGPIFGWYALFTAKNFTERMVTCHQCKCTTIKILVKMTETKH